MRRFLPGIIFLVCLLTAVVWWTGSGVDQRSATNAKPIEAADVAPWRKTAPAAPTPVAKAAVPTPPIVPFNPTAVPAASPLREQRAYRFVLNENNVTLEAVDAIRGDFHPRRGEPDWAAGMLCCRLLDAQGTILAQNTLPAPDHVCVVLDPNIPDKDGAPQPVTLSPSGPVAFQVRMPKFDSAAQMKIYRLAGSRPAVAGLEPEGQLLATVALDR